MSGGEEPPEGYPPYVVTDEQKRRWNAAKAMARQLAEEIGGDETTVWLATRSLYKSDIPTGPLPDDEKKSDQ